MEISVAEFKELSNVNVVDIRSAEKYNTSHIPGAINFSLDKLLINPYNYINKNSKYYFYCQHGMSSLNACRILSKLGFNVVSLKGGYEEWLLNNK